MTILVKYEKQSKETNKILFEKLNNLSNLEWARWGGWFDSDGSFSYDKKYHKISCTLALSTAIVTSLWQLVHLKKALFISG